MTPTLRTFLAVGLICFAITASAQAEVYSDRIVAVVNGDVILASDIQRFKQPFMRGLINFDLGVIPPGKWPTERELLDELIIVDLLDQEALKRGFKLNEKAVEASIESLEKRNKISHEKFVLFLAANGLTYGDFRDLWKRQLRLKGLIAREVAAKAPVTEEDAQKYFKENRGKIEEQFKALMARPASPEPPTDKFQPDVPTHQEIYVGGKVRLRLLTLKMPPRGNKAALRKLKRKAEIISKELLTGASFAQVAKKYSEDPLASKGGDLGYMNYKDMIPQWQKMVQRMKEQQVIGPISTKGAVLFFYLDDAKGRTKKEVPIPEAVRKKLIADQRKLYERRLAERRQHESQSQRREPVERKPDQASPKATPEPASSKGAKGNPSGILTPEEQKDYQKVRDKVMAIIATKKRRERMKEWIKELKSNSIIDVKL